MLHRTVAVYCDREPRRGHRVPSSAPGWTSIPDGQPSLCSYAQLLVLMDAARMEPPTGAAGDSLLMVRLGEPMRSFWGASTWRHA